VILTDTTWVTIMLASSGATRSGGRKSGTAPTGEVVLPTFTAILPRLMMRKSGPWTGGIAISDERMSPLDVAHQPRVESSQSAR
jgi:hypothetical protein